FKANSITWISPQRGWVLGDVPCSGHRCTKVIGTTDGATTWHVVGSVAMPIAKLGLSHHPGITEVRFASQTAGWAFEPYLFHTTDGGRTWSRQAIPGGGRQVLSLAVGSSATYAITSTCKWATGLCNHQPLSLWRTTTPTGTSWTKVTLALPANVVGPDVEA